MSVGSDATKHRIFLISGHLIAIDDQHQSPWHNQTESMQGRHMKMFAGTSGYSYKEWKGNFYPERLASTKMLQFYAERLPTVEINNTFYRLPKVNVLESWRQQVPDEFRFVLKASRHITHDRRLKEADEPTEYLLRTVQTLGPQLGAILFQLP